MISCNCSHLSVILPPGLQTLLPAPIDEVAAAALFRRLLAAMRALSQRSGGDRLIPLLPTEPRHVLRHGVPVLRMNHGLVQGRET